MKVPRRIASVLAASALLVGTALVLAGPAAAGRAPQAVFHGSVAHVRMPTGSLCDNTGDAMSDAISSQNFDSKFDAYDSMGATDCKLTQKATIHTVVVPGTYFNGNGPAKWERFKTYKDAAGLPGARIDTQKVVGADDAGTFTLTINPLTLNAGTYWFTVQAKMAFSKGQWGWVATATAHGQPDQWRNPGNGFALCDTWCPVSTLDGTSSDLVIGLS